MQSLRSKFILFASGVILVTLQTNFAYAEGYQRQCNLLFSEPNEFFQNSVRERESTMLAAIYKKDPNFSGKLDMEETPSDVGGKTILKLKHQGRTVATGFYKVINETLRFDINIDSSFQGRKIYHYLMAYVLARHPNVKKIPARFGFRHYSENYFIFVENIFETERQMLTQTLGSNFRSSSNIAKKELRQKILNAYYSTPAGKVRESLGFAKLTRIVFNLAEQMLSFNVEKGERPDPSHVEVAVVVENPFPESPWRQIFLVDSNGDHHEQSKSFLELPDYLE